jgi:hypothetical protein
MNKDRQRITLVATSISYVLVILDTSIVNVALENISMDAGTDVWSSMDRDRVCQRIREPGSVRWRTG